MPEKDDNALFLGLLVIPVNGFIDSSIVVGLPVEPGIMRGVILHIEPSNDGSLGCFCDKIIVIEGGLS